MDETIGALLRRTREQRQLSLPEVAEATRLRLPYLQALENDDLSAIPSAAQARGFLRIYGDHLGLNIDELLGGGQPSGAPLTSAAAATAVAVPQHEHPKATPGWISSLRRRLRPAPGKNRKPSGASDSAEGGGPAHADDTTAEGTTAGTSVPGSEHAVAAASPDAPHNEDSTAEVAQETGSVEAESARTAVAGHGISKRIREWRVLRQPRPRGVVAQDQPPDQSVSPAHPSLQGPLDTPEVNAEPYEEPADQQESSGEIFADLGRQLRARRELLGLTEDEVERHSRVKASFVRALERASLEDVPSPVQTRGILASYAGFLDLDVDAVLLRFAEGLQARHREQKPEPQAGRSHAPLTVHTTVPPLRSFIASDLIFGVGIAILLVLFAAWGITSVLATRSSSQAYATSPSISDVLAGTAVSTAAAEVTLIPAQDTAAAPTGEIPVAAGAAEATLGTDAALQLSVATSERTYMRVTVDGKAVFDGRTLPGTEYTYQGAEQIELLAGNASALRVSFNSRDLGLMGGFGEVVDRIYTADGVFTPTPAAPPTPTASPNITATPSITPTPTLPASPTTSSGG